MGGIGGTLAGYALSLAAVRATLGEVLTPEAYAHTIPLAERWEAGVRRAIEARDVPWYVTRLGCRAEYHFLPSRGTDGARALGGERLRARALPPPARAQPRDPPHALPQHGADVPGDDRRPGGPPHPVLRGGHRGPLRGGVAAVRGGVGRATFGPTAGSGTPRESWRRAAHRAGPARVFESSRRKTRRRGSRPAGGSAMRTALARSAAILVAAALVASCGSAPTTPPAPSASAGPSATRRPPSPRRRRSPRPRP